MATYDNPFDESPKQSSQMANPFDDPSVTKTTANTNNSYGEDAYVIETNNRPAPPPPPPSQPSQPSAAHDQIDIVDHNAIELNPVLAPAPAPDIRINDSYGSSADPPAKEKMDDSSFATFEVQETDDHSNLYRSFCGYSPMVRIWAGLAGICFMVGAVISMLNPLNWVNPIKWVENGYLFLIGFNILVLEIPPSFCFGCNAGLQKKTYRWARLMRRYWGRALMYLFFSLLCLLDQGSENGTTTAKIALGGVVMGICFLMWIVSFVSAGAARQIYSYVTKNATGDEARQRWEHAFHEIAHHKDALDADDLQRLGRISGRWMNASERFTLLRYFDEFITNDITLKEWMLGMEGLQRGVRWL